MALVSKVIPGLYNGISQQPSGVRLDTQCEIQENAFSSLATGLRKRPPEEFIAKLNITNQVDKPFIHTINRDVSERYIVVITGEAVEPIEVFNLSGSKMAVQYGQLSEDLVFTPDASVKSYVSILDPRLKVAAVTIADYTIVVNKQVPCLMDTTTAYPGTLKATVQSFDDLPTTPTLNNIYRISGDRYDQFSAYFVKYDGDVYVECPEPGTLQAFDSTTLPHRLVRTAEGTFTFAPILWNERKVGNDDNIPTPSFVDNTIADVGMFKNRLYFFSGENAVFSRSADFFNFWGSTALEVLDGDPVDIALSSEKVSLLKYGISFQDALLAFSDQLQFAIHSGEQTFTPDTAAADVTTRFEASPHCKPVGAGPNVYFVSPRGGHSSVREYFVQPSSLVNDAADVTAHTPTYLPKNIFKLSSSSSLECIFALSSDEPGSIYVYKYYWQGDEKVQSSWGKWTFTGDVVEVSTIENLLVVLISRHGELHLSTLDLEEEATTGTLGFRVGLDMQTELTGSYADGITTWSLPYNAPDLTPLTIILSDTGAEIIGVSTVLSNTLCVQGDFSGTPCYIGNNYTMRYRFTPFSVRSEEAKVDILEGRLQVRTLTLSYVNTGYFRVEVTPYNREALISEYTGAVIGESLLGAPSILSGVRRMPVIANARRTTIDIVNDTHLPSIFQSGSWEGFFTKRSRGL